MPALKQDAIYGWGHAPVAQCDIFRPEKTRDVASILSHQREPLIARGLGRSYGDASLQPHGVIDTTRLTHMLSFDSERGIIHAQAGVSLADIMAFAIPGGWLPPVIPGTKHVTLGGCFACNVHGKNQFREGDFAKHVLAVTLLMADGKIIECSREEHADLFFATAGGMGMTGIVLDLTLQLKPIASASLSTLTYKVSSVHDMIAAFEHYRGSADYMVGWIDHAAKGAELGRGVFEAAHHITSEEGGQPLHAYQPPRARLHVPFFAPSFLLNKHLMAYYNKWRFKQYSSERSSEIVGFNNFFHPLDAIGNWNRLYGRRGFFQYQCLIPETAGVSGVLLELLSLIHQHHLFSFLAVLKYHRDGVGALPFSRQGYSLALDFPNTPEVRRFMPLLNDWVAKHEGRVYLAKDAQLTAAQFAAMYGEHTETWKTAISEADPYGRFASLMSERLQWKRSA